MMNGTHTACLDRIVDGKTAVLLLEDDGETVNQLTVDVEELPAAGRHERAIFKVETTGEDLVAAEYWPGEEEKRLEAAREWSERTGKRLDNTEE